MLCSNEGRSWNGPWLLLSETHACLGMGRQWSSAYHLLLQLACVSVAQLCLTLWDPMDCSHPPTPTVSSVPGILQSRILEWVAIFSSRGSSPPRDRAQVSCTVGRFFTIWAANLINSQKMTAKVPSTFSVLFCLVFNHLIEESWVHINFCPSSPLPHPAPPHVFSCQGLSATVLWWISYFDSKILVFLTKQDFSLLLTEL